MRALSLGAGVQSTTLLLMALDGQFDRPDVAIFADTGWEPPQVYEHLKWLEAETEKRGFKIERVSAGNIRSDFLQAVIQQRHGVRAASMPLHVEGNGILRRQCTRDYKIGPIRRRLKEILKERGEKHVEVWYGISFDEVGRMHTSDVSWISNEYPLIKRHMTRNSCLVWLKEHGYPEPPKSACMGCPYHNNSEWWKLQADPKLWKDVTDFDDAIRKVPGIDGQCFLHHSARPLKELDFKDTAQTNFDMFNAECEGVCAV